MPDVQAMTEPLRGPGAAWVGTGFPQAHLPPGTALRRMLRQWSGMAGLAGTAHAETPEALLDHARSPTPIEERLHALCSGIVDQYTDRAQTIRLEIAVDGACPVMLEGTVLHIVRQAVGNIIRYGMRLRLIGRVCVRLHTRDGTTLLSITDDGWDCHDHSRVGDGWHRIGQLVRRRGGCVTLHRGHVTTLDAELPHCACEMDAPAQRPAFSGHPAPERSAPPDDEAAPRPAQ